MPLWQVAHFHNHASKGNQSTYPWSQCIVAVGLLKKVKSRWACLPLSFRFYMMKKSITEKLETTLVRGKSVLFKTKMQQSADMIKSIYSAFNKPILVVADSWFGNNGLWKCLDKGQNGNFNILSRLRVNNKDKAAPIWVFLYGKKREVLVYSRNVMSKNLQREIKVVWVFRKTRFVAFYTTDLTLSAEQIVEY
ncbi:MAG: transposase [Proteobacteria bacterium]|nr:transposase [Pseudomonadota bacterium]